MQQTSIWGYFLGAGIVVKLVMLILLVASVVSWTLIFQRYWFFKQQKAEYKQFKHRFMGCSDLKTLYQELDTNPEYRYGLASIFYGGFKTFLSGRAQGEVITDNIARVMQIYHAKQEEKLEAHLPFFASVGSIAPYIGLFGTVWGIMTSFQALGAASQATIAMVAPGISEALVATALGLFTAIPAVIAYNRYQSQASSLLDQYDIFQEELIALMHAKSQTNKAS